MEEFVDLAQRRVDLPEEEFRREMDRFAGRFPQVVRVAEKVIWEDGRAAEGVAMLDTIGTPAAFEALRRFGLSQAGDDDDRVQALLTLVRTDQIAPDEPVWVWKDGEWREMLLRGYEIAPAPPVAYDPQVAELLSEAQRVLQAGDDEQAERLFQRALELEPQTREAYNNLGSIYAQRGQHDRAREMFQAAIEIDPLYAIPRCNLATYLIHDGDLDGAEEMLEPLADARRFHPQEMAFYSVTQARLAIEREEYDKALNALKMALDIFPGYDLAEGLLDWLDQVLTYQAVQESPYFKAQRERDQAWRERLQGKLSTLDTSLEEALPHYTKEVLTGTARAVVLSSGWSTLRKAELVQRIIESLTDRYQLEMVLENLSDEELAALRDVMAHGGHMQWDAFDAQYGNDLDESRYWQWHEPETIMGRLRLHGLLVEATVDETLWLVVPTDLRKPLATLVNRET
jgi:tetratricopeptide (TPR) repeat protein